MRMYDLIDKKKNGQALSKAEIEEMIDLYVDGAIPDYQMAAWLMAVYFQGITKLFKYVNLVKSTKVVEVSFSPRSSMIR